MRLPAVSLSRNVIIDPIKVMAVATDPIRLESGVCVSVVLMA